VIVTQEKSARSVANIRQLERRRSGKTPRLAESSRRRRTNPPAIMHHGTRCRRIFVPRKFRACHMHTIVNRGTVAARNEGAARA